MIRRWIGYLRGARHALLVTLKYTMLVGGVMYAVIIAMLWSFLRPRPGE